MIFNETYRMIFASFCIIISFLIILFNKLMLKKQNSYKKIIITISFVSLLTIISYTLFILVDKNHSFLANLFQSFYITGTAWLSLCMFIFTTRYTDILTSISRKLVITGFCFTVLDTISLVINSFFHQKFVLQIQENVYVGFFWVTNITPLFYLHLLLCYSLIGISFIILLVKSITSPKMYKSKYISILTALSFVIIANAICFKAQLPFDISVLFYGALTGFCVYFTTYSFPERLLNKTLKEINENISDAILYFNINKTCIYANSVARKLFSISILDNNSDVQKFLLSCEDYLKENPDKQSRLVEFEVNDKKRYYNAFYYHEYLDGQFIGYLIRLADITIETERQQKAEYNIKHDELTKILNRVGFIQEVDEFVRIHGTTDYYMITTNIKDFKLINQLFGDKIGDKVLIQEAEFLKETSKYGSIFARLQDDIFALFVKNDFFVENKFNYFISKLTQITQKSSYQMHIHVGVYDPKGQIESAQIMIDKANLAINQIKNNLDKTFSFYDPIFMEQFVTERKINSEIEQALAQEQIKLFFQPIINSNNKLVGIETLCRWEHPYNGILSPKDFLPSLEHSGRIYQLDEYIWNKTFELLQKWNNHSIFITLNISEKDFFFIDIYAKLTSLVGHYRISPSQIHLEIKESVIMADFVRISKILDDLRKFGFVISIDNFGSGYTFLNMLKDIAPQFLKIDTSLLRNAEGDERNKIIIETIIQMAHSLKIKVIGLGVENKRIYDLLLNNNCSLFQGFYFEQPISLTAFEDKYLK